MNSALPIPVPNVSISTVLASPFPAPNVISAIPAASASLTTLTSSPVASASSARASSPIQPGSTLAAVLVMPFITTPGKVMPTGPDQLNVLTSWATTSATASGVAGCGVSILLPLGQQLARCHVHRRGLDPRAADVNAECVHESPSPVMGSQAGAGARAQPRAAAGGTGRHSASRAEYPGGNALTETSSAGPREPERAAGSWEGGLASLWRRPSRVRGGTAAAASGRPMPRRPAPVTGPMRPPASSGRRRCGGTASLPSRPHSQGIGHP